MLDDDKAKFMTTTLNFYIIVNKNYNTTLYQNTQRTNINLIIIKV